MDLIIGSTRVNPRFDLIYIALAQLSGTIRHGDISLHMADGTEQSSIIYLGFYATIRI